jgi:hypothetical protein
VECVSVCLIADSISTFGSCDAMMVGWSNWIFQAQDF